MPVCGTRVPKVLRIGRLSREPLAPFADRVRLPPVFGLATWRCLTTFGGLVRVALSRSCNRHREQRQCRSLADLAGGEAAADRVVGWVGHGALAVAVFSWALRCGLGTRTANRELMIASFGNSTLISRVKFPKLAIMTPGGPTCWAGGAASPAGGKSRPNQALARTAPSPTSQSLAQHRDDQ